MSVMSVEAATWPLSLDMVLEPISAARPSGESLRYDVTYDRIKEARRQDDPNLPQGVWQTELKRAEWEVVEATCLDALTTRSKDLQIAAWLLEAWIHLHGLSGLTVGLQMLTGLCQNFWDTMYPEVHADNYDLRLSPVQWINEKMPLQLRQIPITRPRKREVPACTWGDWETKPGAEHAVGEEALRESVASTPTPFFVEELSLVEDALAITNALEEVLVDRCGEQVPSLVQFKGVLANIRDVLTAIVAERRLAEQRQLAEERRLAEESSALEQLAKDDAVASAPEPHDTLDGDGEGGPQLTAGSSLGGVSIPSSVPIYTRDDAYQRLADIADFLMRVEPHSPTPYLIKRAVSWGHMPLGELLQELVQNPSELQAIYALLDIKQGGEP